MGFGLLFIGYLFAFGYTAGANYMLALIGIVGACIIFFACAKLSEFSKSMAYAKYASVILAVLYFTSALCELIARFADIDNAGALTGIIKACIVAFTFVFHYFMYVGLQDIASTAECKKVYVRSILNMIAMIVYYVLLISMRVFDTYINEAVMRALGLLSAALGLLWLVLNVVLLLSAYMRICMPGDEDMPEKQLHK